MQKSVLSRPTPGVAYLRPTPCNFLPGLWQQCLRLSFCSLQFIPVLQPKYSSCKNQILHRRKSFSKLTHWSGSHSSALFLPAPPFLHVPLNAVYSLLTRPSVTHIRLLLVNCVEFFCSYYGGGNHTQGCTSILPFSCDLALFFTLHNPAEDCYVWHQSLCPAGFTIDQWLSAFVLC